MKRWLIIPLLTLLSPFVQAQDSDVPDLVLDFYHDAVGVMVTMTDDLNAADSAQAAAAAIDKAVQTIRTLDMRARFHDLKGQYPALFERIDGGFGDNPPPAWRQLQTDIEQSRDNFTAVMKTKAAFFEDAAVTESLGALARSLDMDGGQ